jgi:hypothetical protein
MKYPFCNPRRGVDRDERYQALRVQPRLGGGGERKVVRSFEEPCLIGTPVVTGGGSFVVSSWVGNVALEQRAFLTGN